MTLTEVVYLVDDDFRVRESMADFFAVHALRTKCFDSASAYLAHQDDAASSCLILDLELADVNGLELQRQLRGSESAPPIIFVSGGKDVATTVRAMKAGAVDFLTKPVDTCLLLSAVQSALEKDKRQRKKQSELAVLRVRFESLTPREREVFPLIVGGLLNKQSAGVLAIAHVTLQIHRGQVMRKMKAESLPDLVRMAIRLGIRPYMVRAAETGCVRTLPSARLSLATSTR
ncbi:response regulator transcription factor [Acidicapsa ligni]|uniref:response regulator transcription factor n=1 Tax=Acidicapsa ligni TaxID=542300 RepID=UPI0021DFA01A|nr:response regulator [Acidicapsa ligni]